MAGKRKAGVAKNNLPFEFIRFVELVRPKAVLIENVLGILSPFLSDGNSETASKQIVLALSNLDYNVGVFKLNSALVGVAEKRIRVFFLALRKDVFSRIARCNGVQLYNVPVPTCSHAGTIQVRRTYS